MSIKGQGHSLTLTKGYAKFKSKLVFFKKRLGHFNQISYESLWENRSKTLYKCVRSHDQDIRSRWDGGAKNCSKGLGHMTKTACRGRGTKSYSNGLCHMTKMTAMQIYGKTNKTLLQKLLTKDLEA